MVTSPTHNKASARAAGDSRRQCNDPAAGLLSDSDLAASASASAATSCQIEPLRATGCCPTATSPLLLPRHAKSNCYVPPVAVQQRPHRFRFCCHVTPDRTATCHRLHFDKEWLQSFRRPERSTAPGHRPPLRNGRSSSSCDERCRNSRNSCCRRGDEAKNGRRLRATLTTAECEDNKAKSMSSSGDVANLTLVWEWSKWPEDGFLWSVGDVRSVSIDVSRLPAMKAQCWAVLIALFSSLQAPRFAHQISPSSNLYVQFRNFIFEVFGRTSTPMGLGRAANLHKLQTPVPGHVPFPCDVTNARSPRRPTSVHQLRPGDIDVIGAMGDSLTAANGAAASRLFDVAAENRGLSWSIGGQGTWREYLTLPNILKQFNPRLVGYSLADSFSHHAAAQFNVAELGSMSKDMLYMARVLVKRIRADKRVHFEKDWKVISLMVGANDFCLEFCYMSENELKNAGEVHRRELTSTLDYLRDHLPRTLVNLILVPNLEILHDLKGLPYECSQLHLIACPCLFGKIREAAYPAYIAKQREWQRIQREVAEDDRYRRKEDFAVVLQPFTAHLVFPEVETPRGPVADRSFLSEDCFHFSQKAYARAANALWNNMFEPVGNKSENWAPTFSRFVCPTAERPYIFTHGNSIGR